LRVQKHSFFLTIILYYRFPISQKTPPISRRVLSNFIKSFSLVEDHTTINNDCLSCNVC